METKIETQFIYNSLKTIVLGAHKNPLKQEIYEKTGGGWQISCPYCGDSQQKATNYRGNLNTLLFYKCFNCNRKSHFSSMCKDFGIPIPIDIKLKIYEYLDSNISFKQYQDDFSTTDVKNFLSLEELAKKINNGTCANLALSDFKPIVNNSVQDIYLNLRGIPSDLRKNIYQASFWITSEIKQPVIVLLNRKNDTLIGMQVRNLKEGLYRNFHIYTFQELLEELHPEHDMADGEISMYNKLSYYYNILNVDFNKKITLFEGYIDSIFYPNSVGLVGTNTETNFFENNDLDIQFFYDNDYAGFQKSIEKLENGFKVFLWNKLFKDIVSSKKSDDPYSLEYRIKKVKDLNKLASLTNNPYEKLKLNNYFSVDKYDKIFLPPKKKIYNKQIKNKTNKYE